ncbi:MAG: SIR2 family protein [Peptostreptococcaceae bacterium]|jgi:XTP/dITP diphosphohydrolase|nr:SIR2 family protein [Peptostreptococcaceae bacterium]
MLKGCNNKKEIVITLYTTSKYKENEFNEMAKGMVYKFKALKNKKDINEPQKMTDIKSFMKQKTLEAYKKYKRPIIVEHTMLSITHFNGLPNHITGEFCDKMSNYEICKQMEGIKLRDATARSVIGFCDGKNIKIFEGFVEGYIANSPIGDNGFGWDNIFIPMGEIVTYAQMSPKEKNKKSMRRKALQELIDYLKDHTVDFFDESDSNLEDLKKDLVGLEKHKDKVKEGLIEFNEDKNLILFVGAGVPRNLNLPSWYELMEEIGEDLGFDKDVFMASDKDFLSLAEYASIVDLEKFKNKCVDKFNLDKLDKDELDINYEIDRSNIYRYIVKLEPKKIYTTNYEDTIEKAFRIHGNPNIKIETIKLSNEENEQKDKSGNVLEIVKLHGDINDLVGKKVDNLNDLNKNMVLTESGYFNAIDCIDKTNIDKENNEKINEEDTHTQGENEKNCKSEVYRYLAKDLGQNKGNVIIFLGYSLSDFNIRYFLEKCREKAKKEENKGDNDKNKFYMFTTTPNPIQEKILNHRDIKIIYGKDPEPKQALKKFLYDIVEAKKYEKKKDKGNSKEENTEGQ